MAALCGLCPVCHRSIGHREPWHPLSSAEPLGSERSRLLRWTGTRSRTFGGDAREALGW
jgi:hypothetical protein